ncbi:hypothetical protein Kisp01_44660 [Kineosporia sp. NBRC 101677]|nr:hypothetical protein Kisp01_44660 [Kineosporia sp. NBRC 101677]
MKAAMPEALTACAEGVLRGSGTDWAVDMVPIGSRCRTVASAAGSVTTAAVDRARPELWTVPDPSRGPCQI